MASSSVALAGARPRWFVVGDWNAFFALLLDNMINLVVFAGILMGGFGFPRRWRVCSLSTGPGQRRKRLWMVRRVTSTRAPRSLVAVVAGAVDDDLRVGNPGDREVPGAHVIDTAAHTDLPARRADDHPPLGEHQRRAAGLIAPTDGVGNVPGAEVNGHVGREAEEGNGAEW